MPARVRPWGQTDLREREAAKLKARFAVVSRRSFRRRLPRTLRRMDWPLLGLFVALGAAVTVITYCWSWNSNIWPANQTILQATFIQSCGDARRIGIVPLYSGYPGYRASLDRDGDGIACEPYPF